MILKNSVSHLMTVVLAAAITACGAPPKQTENEQSIKETGGNPKILFVLTSHATKGDTGEKTGYYLSEVSHPWEVLTAAGYEIDFVSPKGGNPPVDGFDLSDPASKRLWEDDDYRGRIEHSKHPSEIDPGAYKAIFYAGGHGAMWDLPYDQSIAEIASVIYENHGIVAAVCHGPAGLTAIRLHDGNYLVNGKRVNGFSNEEEEIVQLTEVVPFLLEDRLKALGGIYEKSAPWKPHVTVDGRLITGQNPQSARGVGEVIRDALKP